MFNPDGTLKYVEMDIVNLNGFAVWEKVCIPSSPVTFLSHFYVVTIKVIDSER